jgi:hypothetical protein
LSSGALEKVDIDFSVKERIGIHRISPLSLAVFSENSSPEK